MVPERAPFSEQSLQVGNLGIIAMESCKDLAEKVDAWLRDFRSEHRNGNNSSFIVKSRVPRFGNGEAKGIIDESIRGMDLYILLDVGNYSCTYNFMGKTNSMSPDDHFQDLKRIISAAAGKAKRINVIMPFLYGGRQHKRMVRESLDCAVALQELENLNVTNIITFDAHDARVHNAIPFTGFENIMPYYQFTKSLLRTVPDIKIDKDNLMVVSPDEGGIHRNIYFSSTFGLDLGVFYKRRDFTRLVNGRNPIVAHEFIGGDVEGKDVLVCDDMISSGDSVLDIAQELKKRKARRIFVMTTYALFTDGVDALQKAYESGILDRVFSTNLTYRRPELADCEWFTEVDMSKYIAKIIDQLNYDESLGNLIDPSQRITNLLEKFPKN